MDVNFLIDSFKRSKISLTDIKCLLHLCKRRKFKELICQFNKFKKKNNDFFFALQSIPSPSTDSLLNFTNSNKILKKVNKFFKRQMLKIADKIHLFFVQLSQDPTFISLDTEFINNPSQTSYNNLISYVELKNDAFVENLNLSNELTITLTMMSDDRIPMYNENSDINTYEDMINGNIVFDTRDEYIGGIKSIATGHYEKYYPLQGILIAYKVGQTAQQKIETSSGGTLLAFGFLILYALLNPKDRRAEEVDPKVDLFLLILALVFILVGAILLKYGSQ
jgi:hypothetical protein